MTPHVRLVDVSKAYGPATVLKHVSFDVLPGEVHVLAGENGAGKSTLIKVLGGIVTDYSGTVEIGGEPVRLRSPLDAASRGVAVIHQELSLVPLMSIVDNLFLGEMPTRGGLVQRGAMREAAQAALARVGLDLPLDTPVERLPIAAQQLVEIAKALRHRAKVVVMDEPTSALNVQEAERLFALVGELKAQSVGIVYISHKMDEIERLADRITVLRDGEQVATRPAAELPVPALVRLMVGRSEDGSPWREERLEGGTVGEGVGAPSSYSQAQGEVVSPPSTWEATPTERTVSFASLPSADPPTVFHAGARSYPSRASEGEPSLRAENIRIIRDGRTVVDGVSLAVGRGEVVGLAGLEGSGNSALLLGLFGAYGRIAGAVQIEGRRVTINDPRDAIRHRLALLTSDRKATGLVLPLSVAANVTLAALPRLSPGGWRSERREKAAAEKGKRDLSIRAASLGLPVGALSGGNQQKVALAKWIETDPKVLLLDEPTRGIDVGAKREIYTLIEGWKARGMAIVLITSELPELLLLADRILVMHRGRVVSEMTRAEATADRVVGAAMNA